MSHQIAARVPAETYRLLRAMTAVLHTSQADVLSRALESLSVNLPADQRRILRLLLRNVER